MKKIFMFLAAMLIAVTMSAQTVQNSRTFENISVTVTGGVITTDHLGGNTFFWGGAENIVKGLRPVAGLEISKYVTPVVGFGLEGLAMFNTTGANTIVDQHNVVGNLKLNLSNWFGGYKGEPRRVEVVFVPGLGWGHDYGDVYHDRNYLTYNLGAELNVNLGKARAWQINVKPVVMWNNYNNALRPMLQNMQGRLQIGLTYKFGSKSKKSHNFVYCPYSVTASDYDNLNSRYASALQENKDLKNKVSELEAREPEVKEVVKEIFKETKINNVTVYFDKGSYELSERELSHLDFYAQHADKAASIKIVGSADSATGSPKRNAYLAEQRALAVKKVLVENYGFDESKIEISTAQDMFDTAIRSRVAIVE